MEICFLLWQYGLNISLRNQLRTLGQRPQKLPSGQKGRKMEVNSERERTLHLLQYDYDTHTEHNQAVIISLVQAVSSVNNLSPQLLLF